MTQQLKFGRNRPTVRYPKLSFSNYIDTSILPTIPSTIDYTIGAETAISQMYNNDTLGDCVIACVEHLEGVLTGDASDNNTTSNSQPLLFTSNQTIAFYSAACGYQPGRPQTDQGCDIQTVLHYWQTNDSPKGSNHKIAGILAVDAANTYEQQLAIYLFENLIFGCDLPDAWVNPEPRSNGFVWDVAGNIDQNNGHCLKDDTKIPLLNGKEYTIKELADGIAGDEFYVYSCDEKGNIVPGKAHSPRITQINAELVEIILDNNESVFCTSDHLFLCHDGKYCKAIDLKEGQSLMPLYRRKSYTGYEEVYNPRTNGWRNTYKQVSENFFDDYEKHLVIHHWDFNKDNNSPENLKLMTHEEHQKLHYECGKILNDYAKSDKGRAKSKELMESLWANSEWADSQRERLKKSASERGKKNIMNGGGFAGLDRDKFLETCRKVGISQIPRITSSENLKKATEAKYIKSQTRLKQQENSISVVNHKVVSVKLSNNADVYDLTVDKYHNFALSSGIFVHNCFLGLGYDASGVKISTWGMTGTITYAATQKYLTDANYGELYVVISEDQLNSATELAPNGLNWTQLVSDFNALGGNVVISNTSPNTAPNTAPNTTPVPVPNTSPNTAPNTAPNTTPVPVPNTSPNTTPIPVPNTTPNTAPNTTPVPGSAQWYYNNLSPTNYQKLITVYDAVQHYNPEKSLVSSAGWLLQNLKTINAYNDFVVSLSHVSNT